MKRAIPFVLIAAMAFVAGCAGPQKLTQQSQEKLARGEPWRAWTLATKALDKAPGNPSARAAATAAADAISADWRRRIHALAQTDSIAAAEQVLEFAAFREAAARYATVPTTVGWPDEEQALRGSAARTHYEHGVADLASKRPRRAYLQFVESERFVADYRDASVLASRALAKGRTRVAFVPLRTISSGPSLGREVAASWRGEVTERLTPPEALFTQVLPTEDIEKNLSVSALGRLSRDQAVQLARRSGADRVVWGTIGEVDSKTSYHVFSDKVARRVVEKDAQGNRTQRWVDVSIDVLARVRTVTADVEYEVIATRGGATLARRKEPCTMSARVIWTAYVPEGGGESYALVSDAARSADPEHAKQVETRWKVVAGEETTLSQVLDAKRTSRSAPVERRDVLARFIAGAAFVLLEELPESEDLAVAAVSRRWKPVYEDLLRLDTMDDVDLGLTAADR